MKTKSLLAFVFVFVAAPALADDLPAGKVKLIGEYETQREKEADREKTYFVLEEGQVMRLRAGGPTSVVILARSRKRATVTFDLKLDADKQGKAKLVILRKPSRSFYVRIPPGTHTVFISASKPVLLRPKKVKRMPRKGDRVIAWRDIPAPQAVAETAAEHTEAAPLGEPAPALAELEPEPLAPEPIVPPKEPEEIKPTEAVAEAMPPTEEKALEEVKRPEVEPPKQEAPPVKAEDVKKALAQQFEPKIDLTGRPVEVRLRILADRLAAGMSSLPGKGRYERFIVARFGENGADVKDMELGTLVSAQLSTYLKRDHGFFLLERERLADVLKEIEMSMTGLTDPRKAAKLGKMAGAQAMVVGSVSLAGADFVINARVISVEKATVLVAESMNVPRAGMIALSEESVVLRTKSGALFRSVLIPGWGQIYNRQPVKGGIVMATEFALIGAAVTMHVLGYLDEDAYLHDNEFALRSVDPATRDRLEKRAIALRQSAEDYYQVRNILIYSAIGVWVYNILDAYIFGIDGDKEAGFQVTPTSGVDALGLGIGLTY